MFCFAIILYAKLFTRMVRDPLMHTFLGGTLKEIKVFYHSTSIINYNPNMNSADIDVENNNAKHKTDLDDESGMKGLTISYTNSSSPPENSVTSSRQSGEKTTAIQMTLLMTY